MSRAHLAAPPDPRLDARQATYDRHAAAAAMRRRALAMWPRLDPAALRRCGDDPACIAALVERRSALPTEAVIGILTTPTVTEDEGQTWFG
jgi:hypothetical protein